MKYSLLNSPLEILSVKASFDERDAENVLLYRAGFDRLAFRKHRRHIACDSKILRDLACRGQGNMIADIATVDQERQS